MCLLSFGTKLVFLLFYELRYSLFSVFRQTREIMEVTMETVTLCIFEIKRVLLKKFLSVLVRFSLVRFGFKIARISTMLYNIIRLQIIWILMRRRFTRSTSHQDQNYLQLSKTSSLHLKTIRFQTGSVFNLNVFSTVINSFITHDQTCIITWLNEH